MIYYYLDNNRQVSVSVNSLFEALNYLPKSQVVVENFVKAWSIINNPNIQRICCCISGGADSDILMDLITKCDLSNKTDYYYFDTGFEYTATKHHIRFLEKKYNKQIIWVKAKKPIPITCKKYGIPFLSKMVSENMMRLQRVNFKWEDKPFEELIREYCKEIPEEKAYKNGKLKKGYVLIDGKYYRGVYSALQWWCNQHESNQFNISHNKWLKEFVIKNPPNFSIANKCCKYAKKDVAHDVILSKKYELNVIGARKSEGGIRATAYKSCFDDNGKIKTSDGYWHFNNYRPLYWYKNEDKEIYKSHFLVNNSICYSTYGLARTGCCGCPFSQDLEKELDAIKKYEPKFYKAVYNVFGESYEYTKKYRSFQEEMKKKYFKFKF